MKRVPWWVCSLVYLLFVYLSFICPYMSFTTTSPWVSPCSQASSAKENWRIVFRWWSFQLKKQQYVYSWIVWLNLQNIWYESYCWKEDLNYVGKGWKMKWTLNTTSYHEEDANPDANAEEQEENQDRNEQPLFLRRDGTFFQIFSFSHYGHLAHCSLPIAHWTGKDQD